MRLVLRDSIEKIVDKLPGDKVDWEDFKSLYETLENFDYPHKEKLLDFIKYFFLDHIVSADRIVMNSLAFKEALLAKRPLVASEDKSRNDSTVKSRRKSGDSQASSTTPAEEALKRKILGSSSP